MKRITSLLTCFFCCICMLAGEISKQEAVQIAQQFVPLSSSHQKGKRAAAESSTIVYTQMMPGSDRAAFYIVNVGDNAFVLVSADDAAQQVLGYSLNRNFPVKSDGSIELPAHIKGFLEDLAAQVKVAVKDGGRTKAVMRQAPRRAANLPESVDPLVTTTWDQGQYYNVLCPVDAKGPGGHVWAGCVATAMAQIIKFWEPTQKRGSHYYMTDKYGKFEVNFAESNFDYANMPNALTAGSSEAQVNAVAMLMYQCGVACNMEYGPEESGSYDTEARAALINYFGFNPDMGFAEKRNFTTEDWNTMLRENLAAHHPVIYSGRKGKVGHMFICDGYKADNFFHFNFGWGGSFDGWFLTSAIDPSGDSGYNSEQAAIVDIIPYDNGHVILGQVTGTSTFTVNEPLEFYNSVGHNPFEDTNYDKECNSYFVFKSADATKQLVVDINELEDQRVTIYDGEKANAYLRSLSGGHENDMSPVVSSSHALTLNYNGNLYNAGFKLTISQDSECRMVSNITSAVENTTAHLTWTENGGATQWQVEYGEKGFAQGSGTLYNATSNTVTFENLQKFTEYDFYIRSVKDGQYSHWNKTTIMVEAPYWHEVVTTEPEGYHYDARTNTAKISTAEGLTWWAKTNSMAKAVLTADIDLGAYKWKPAQVTSFDGQGHVISNGHIIEPQAVGAGFISEFATWDASNRIENLGLDHFYVKGRGGSTGALIGQLRQATVQNCFVTNSSVDGDDNTGGLIGQAMGGSVVNCYVNVHSVGARWASLMVGSSSNTIMRNCYAAGSFRQRAFCYNGGVMAYGDGGVVANSYSVRMPMGVIGHPGTCDISDTTTVVRTDEGILLMHPVTFDEQPVTDLVSALNAWVAQTNDAAYNTWTADQNGVNDGYPVFGAKYVVECPNVTDLVVENVPNGNKVDVNVTWTDNGDASKWKLRYRQYDTPEAKYTYVETNSKSATIQDLPLGKAYEFNVRAIDNNGHQSGWSETQYKIVDLAYWTDVVTSQPAGYTEDAAGNAAISSAEGLAWFAAKVRGLHGQAACSYEGKTVKLTADIDLKGWRWSPIGFYNNNESTMRCFMGTFDGQEHSISNIYVNDEGSYQGLFSYSKGGLFRNVNMVGGSVATIFQRKSGNQAGETMAAIGGLIGEADRCYEISNCHSSVSVSGSQWVGSLCGYVWAEFDGICRITNCSATGQAAGRESVGDLIGATYGAEIIIQNCYATGDVTLTSGKKDAWNRGGLIGHVFFSTVDNCYATGKVEDEELSKFIGRVIGCPQEAHLHYLYASDDINAKLSIMGSECADASDIVAFHHEASQNTLRTPVTIDGQDYSDLNDVLNAWVTSRNDQNTRTWTLNGDTGYPTFAAYFAPSCANPTDLAITNATTVGDPTIRTELSWKQAGEPKSWEVLYVPSGHDISEGVIVPVTTNPCVLTDLPVGNLLDFYVRAVNSETEKSSWSEAVAYTPDLLHWTEVVTSQPDGYRIDANGNVCISSAEGLAWASSVANSLNGAQSTEIEGRNVIITADIDMSAYRWTPLSFMNCKLDGNHHTISGLYVNELTNNMGFIAFLYRSSVSNLNLSQCRIFGIETVGGLVATATDASISNCTVSGDIKGMKTVGGIVAYQYLRDVSNCSFIGSLSVRSDITNMKASGEYFGGICASTASSSIINCYVVCEVPSEPGFTGIIGGGGHDGLLISNCYYKNYDSGLPIGRQTTPTKNVSGFEGSGTAWTLTNPLYINDAFRYDLVEVLNIWVDANNADNTYSHWKADTENRNGGYPVLLADNETLGIKKLQTSGQPFDVYTVAGQKVASQITTLKHLPRGLYIINGRKVVIQ